MSTLLFDIGATNTRLALLQEGHMGTVVHIRTDHAHDGFERLIAQMKVVAAGERIAQVVGGMRAQREGREGRLILDVNLSAWLGIPVRRRLEEAFGCPVWVENDAVMAALGEAHLGAGIARGVMSDVTVSSGVNFVRLVDGVADPTIARFELGKQLIGDENGRPVSLEALTSGVAMQRQFGRLPASIRNEHVWLGETEHLARGLYNMMLYWAPLRVVFGGSMMKDVDLPQLRSDLAAWPAVWPHELELVRAKLGDEAGLRGALWLSRHPEVFERYSPT